MASSGNHYGDIQLSGNVRAVIGNYYGVESTEEKILKWLSSLEPWPKHEEARNAYQEGTLSWFFEHKTFLSWCCGRHKVLWCPGNMGAGKTILVSAIIDHFLRQSSNAENVRVAFCYCQNQMQLEQTVPAILGSLLAQIYTRGPGHIQIPKDVSNWYMKKKANPLVKQLVTWLAQVGGSDQKTFLILDGLDEVEQGRRRDLIDELMLGCTENMQLLVASRPLPDIREILDDPATIRIRAARDDLQKFVAFQLSKPSNRKLMRLIELEESRPATGLTLRDEIVQRVTKQSPTQPLSRFRREDPKESFSNLKEEITELVVETADGM